MSLPYLVGRAKMCVDIYSKRNYATFFLCNYKALELLWWLNDVLRGEWGCLLTPHSISGPKASLARARLTINYEKQWTALGTSTQTHTKPGTGSKPLQPAGAAYVCICTLSEEAKKRNECLVEWEVAQESLIVGVLVSSVWSTPARHANRGGVCTLQSTSHLKVSLH